MKCIKHHSSKYSFCPLCEIDKLLKQCDKMDERIKKGRFEKAVPIKLKLRSK